MRKLLLKCPLAPGDIIMLTAAVRDLHRCYPDQCLTDVRTVCPELWENNPHLTPLDESDPDVEIIECSYPLIDWANDLPYHCLHGFIEFLNERLGLRIRPTDFKGDIHLSEQEKMWFSQVHEVTGEDTPFWIIAAGGKHDITIKWWETARYQQVVDYFRGKIQFVQVGELGHHHPKLQGVIDLRGQTNLRELVRLVYHSQGVLCSVTALMHLAAAVEAKKGFPPHRPCVVVAGGREPVQWEAYPHHQFIHTIGALPCCSSGGCWKDRTAPLGDGDERDRPEHLCANVSGNLPKCMDLVTPEEVIRRIEIYFHGGALHYLSPSQVKASKRGISATGSNSFDQQPLTRHNARNACETYIRAIPDYPGTYQGRGIVICGGGIRYFTNAWVSIQMLRRSGCALPIQIWHLGKEELDPKMKALVAPFNVECIDASRLRKRFPARILGGWELKPYSLIHCPFREVLLLDADNVPVMDPEFLFETVPFKETGAIFWPDYGRLERTQVVWDNCGVPRPEGPEFESGQMIVDKQRCWKALCLAMWFNENSDFYYQYLHGDKETFHLAFCKLTQPFALVPHPIHSLEGTMCQHDFEGHRIFQHRNTDKWNLFLRNSAVKDFWYEEQCRDYVRQLHRRWDGRAGVYWRSQKKGAKAARSLRIKAFMISCAERESLRIHTLRNLALTDWGDEPVLLQLDPAVFPTRQQRQEHNTLLALRRMIELDFDYYLFLEDDLDFNHHLRHNLDHWRPLSEGRVTLGGLYNPNVRELACDVNNQAIVADPESIYGSQAFLLSRSSAQYLVRHWQEVEGMQDIKMSRLAARLRRPVFYHCPSLVQHLGIQSVWGGGFHQAADFDPLWKA